MWKYYYLPVGLAFQPWNIWAKAVHGTELAGVCGHDSKYKSYDGAFFTTPITKLQTSVKKCQEVHLIIAKSLRKIGISVTIEKFYLTFYQETQSGQFKTTFGPKVLGNQPKFPVINRYRGNRGSIPLNGIFTLSS